jgi:hypothetical protein
MDLSISPDLDARLCYAVVLLCGLFSARTQLYKRFVVLKMNIAEVWLVPTTWMMFGIYLLTPLGLFWLMDRTGALNDTSLFAALLVGLAYPAILEGGFGGLKAPSGLGDVVKPIQAFTDKMIESVNQAAARQQRKFEDFVVNRMVTDAKVFDEIFGLTRTTGVDSQSLDKEVAALDANTSLDPLLRKERKARIIYLYLSSVPDLMTTLTRNKTVMGDRWWNSPVYKMRVIVGCVVVLFIALCLILTVAMTRPSISIGYYVWRAAKVNNTEKDRFRARDYLRSYLLSTNLGPVTYRSLARMIRTPSLPVERVDLCLQLLLQAREQEFHQDLLCAEMVEALRVDSVDVRSRIHEALVWLATKHDTNFKEKEKELATWNPRTGDSVPNLEDWIWRWRKFICALLSTNSTANPPPLKP